MARGNDVFATYRPPNGPQAGNLLSGGIVTASGGLGPYAATAAQLSATDTGAYSLKPPRVRGYRTLPRPDTPSAT